MKGSHCQVIWKRKKKVKLLINLNHQSNWVFPKQKQKKKQTFSRGGGFFFNWEASVAGMRGANPPVSAYTYKFNWIELNSVTTNKILNVTLLLLKLIKIGTSREMPSGFLWDSLGGRDFFSRVGNEFLGNPRISFASIIHNHRHNVKAYLGFQDQLRIWGN